MGGIGGLIGISGGSRSSSATTTNSDVGNTTDTNSNNTDRSVNTGDQSSIQQSTVSLSNSSINVDPGAVSLANDVSKRAQDNAASAISGGLELAASALTGQKPDLSASSSSGKLADKAKGINWKRVLLWGGGIVAGLGLIGGVIFAARRHK
jgi:hypothetical protein